VIYQMVTLPMTLSYLEGPKRAITLLSYTEIAFCGNPS